jgi:exodeoxyribonuclease-3
VKIISWNVNSIRARLEHVLSVVDKYRPDILLLQETRVEDKSFPLEYFEDSGYNVAINGQKGRNGVAIFSKHQLEDVSRHLDGCDEARYLEAFTGGIFVASVYVPNGQEVGCDQYVYKLEFLQNLKNKFLSLRNEIFVIGGDFNVAPEKCDAHNPNYDGTMCTEQERARIKDLRSSGFCDVLAKKGFTWWDYRRSSSFRDDEGFRLDHFYLSEQATQIFRDGEVLRFARELPRPSDHAPIVCDLNL